MVACKAAFNLFFICLFIFAFCTQFSFCNNLCSTKTLPYIKSLSAPPGLSGHVGVLNEEIEQNWGTVRVHYLSKKTQHGKMLSSVQEIAGKGTV